MASLAGRRIAVIGGTGFIGWHLTARLIELGAEVLAVGRHADHLATLASVRTRCKVALADICQADSIKRALRRFHPDVVFHLASHPDQAESFAQVNSCVQVNGLGLVNALEASEAARASLFVYGDSTKDYGNSPKPYSAKLPPAPICSYAIVKSAGWQLCQLVSSFASLKTVALRPTFIYGPGQARNVLTYVRDCVADGQPVRLMGGNQTRDPLFIDDAVEAFVATIDSPEACGHAIPIGGGCEMTVRALCEAAIVTFGGSVPVVCGAEPPRSTEIWRSRCDNRDAARLLRWEPRVSLAEGLSRVHHGTLPAAVPSLLPMQPVQGYYIHTIAPGLEFQMLDRREDGDRRALDRGGRRADDRRTILTPGTRTARASIRSFSAIAGES